jgi:hypothetical protein
VSIATVKLPERGSVRRQVDRRPQPHALTADLHDLLVQVPATGRMTSGGNLWRSRETGRVGIPRSSG